MKHVGDIAEKIFDRQAENPGYRADVRCRRNRSTPRSMTALNDVIQKAYRARGGAGVARSLLMLAIQVMPADPQRRARNAAERRRPDPPPKSSTSATISDACADPRAKTAEAFWRRQ